METLELLQHSVDRIEQRLNTELTLNETASDAGFSVYYYCRLFRDVMHSSVTAYITGRRLKYALYAASQGMSLTDAALLYGFDTHAGFYKAFRREYGCSPSWFLRHHTVSRPERVIIQQEAAIMLTQTQIRKLLTNWEVNNQSAIGGVALAGGALTADNMWTIGEEYLLKAAANRQNVLKHIRIARVLEKQGIQAGTAVPTKTGSDFFEQDERLFLLMKRVPGRILMPEERYHHRNGRTDIGSQYGMAIARLHQALKAAESELELDDVNLIETITGWALPETKQMMEQWGRPLPEEFYTAYQQEFSRLYPKLPRQAIHRDPHPGNILFYGEKVSGLIDFEISENNVRLFDPCYCATGILSEAGLVEGGFELWPELFKGILNGYNSICPLTDEEKQAVPLIVYSIQMICVAWLSNQPDYRTIAAQNREMLYWIWNNRELCFGKLWDA